MFDVERFIDECLAARAETEPRLAVKELLERAMSDAAAVAEALPPERAEIQPLHVSPELTVLKVVWTPGMKFRAHDHRMWAAIGIYSGGEDNAFYRRSDGRLVPSGGKELRVGDACVLGDDTIHSVSNPTAQHAGAIHVYGGDLLSAPRSEWDADTLEERPYDVEDAKQYFEDQNTRLRRRLTAMGDYISTGAVNTWYEDHGAHGAAPVVLLHGGMCTASTWAMQVDAFSAGRRVLVPERRGHGHTADVGELSYETMADDTIAFVEAVVGGDAVDLVGWSDGGDIALLVALQRPDLVRKLVSIGSNFHHDGVLPAFYDGMDDPNADSLGMLRLPYEETSPDGPAHWPIVVERLRRMWATGPTLTVDDLKRITAPALVLVGDDDAIDHAHTVALFEALPQGQLGVVPGTSHLLPIEKPALVNQLILDFLDDGSVVSFLPLRRA